MKLLKKILAVQIIATLILPSINAYAALNLSNLDEGEKYEKIKNTPISMYSNEIEDDNYIKPELKEKAEVLKEATTLVPKTDSKYEVVKVFEDGEYYFVDDTNDYEEAKEQADKIGSYTKNGQAVTSAVVSDDGKVTYSPNGVGRVRKSINGVIDTKFNVVTDVYSSSSMLSASNYINHGYIDDVALLETTSNAAKIQFSAATGWVYKDSGSGNYDLEVVPLNLYKNPSYYSVDKGILQHFISKDITSTTQSGSILSLGVAPSYLKEGKKYLSFDGIYFYEITTNEQAYINLCSDLQEGSKTRSVNANNPQYNYYNYLPFRTKTTYTAAEIDSYIDANSEPTSKLRGIGKYLIACENDYGVNALLTLGVAINESARGMSDYAQNRNNLFGLNAKDNDLGNTNIYKSIEACIVDFTKNYISLGYADCNDWRGNGAMLGNKNVGVNVKYASDAYWGDKAAALAFQIDYALSGKNINNLRDLDNYALVRYTGKNTIVNKEGNLLYGITEGKVMRYIPVGATAALNQKGVVDFNGKKAYEINAERNDTNDIINITGDYDFNQKGYANTDNTVLINKPKKHSTVYKLEDVNGDGTMSILDLSMVATSYNKDNYDFDLNDDGIVDLFDLVRVSKEI